MENERKLAAFSEYSDIFKHVNAFGSYQKKFVFGISLVFTGQGLVIGHLKFVTGTPKFQCSTPNVSCGGINKCCTNCTSYEFDPLFTTVVSEWNLICDRSYLAAIIQALFFVGMLVGSFVSGMLSDAYGRKTVSFGALGSMAISGIAQAFVKSSIALFAFLRFATGAFFISATLSIYILIMEMIGPGYRARMGNVNGFYWCLGDFASILVAYFIRDWRTFVWVSCLPPFLLYFFWWAIPESPRWLVVKGKVKQACEIIMKYGGRDNKTCDPEEVMSLLKSIHNDQIQHSLKAKRYTPLDLVRTPKLRKWTIITSFACLGRRLTLCMQFVVTGVLLLTILAIPEGHATWTTYLAIAGKLVIFQSWASVYLISSELFPTILRNTAQGVGSTAARVGGIAAPFLLLLAQLPGSSIILPMTIFGASAIACGISSLWLPETALRPLYQTTVESEEKPEDYGIPFLQNKAKTAAENDVLLSETTCKV
ncbi:Organic cation transporter protein [Exaiptasia diaphana]|nr:Organic cation transporter protein [Exaiptasia diaphana]